MAIISENSFRLISVIRANGMTGRDIEDAVKLFFKEKIEDAFGDLFGGEKCLVLFSWEVLSAHGCIGPLRDHGMDA